MSCIGCNQAITIQKAQDEKLVNKVIQMAKEQNKTFALYRDAEGALCVADGTGYPIERIITPLMQNS